MEDEDFIIEKDGKQFVDVVKLLPDSLPSGKTILWKRVDEEKIEISVDKHSARGGNPKTIVIKRLVPINELLFEGLGLRFGDGIKMREGQPKLFGFSNTEMNLHRIFLRFSEESLGLKSMDFRARLSIPPSLKDKQKDIESSVSKELSIPLENFWNTQIFERRNIPIVDIKIDATLLGIITHLIFTNLQEIKNNRFSAALLKGIIASEGNIAIRGKRVEEISIAAKEKSERDFIRSLLFNLSIIPGKDKETEGQKAVLIHGLSNFNVVKEFDLVSLHPLKSRAFNDGLLGFKKIEFRKGEGKLLILKSLKDRPKRAFELSKELNRTQKAINWTMNKLQKKGFVECFRVSKNIFWKLTNAGLNLIDNGVTFEELRNN